jgi:cyanophycinase
VRRVLLVLAGLSWACSTAPTEPRPDAAAAPPADAGDVDAGGGTSGDAGPSAGRPDATLDAGLDGGPDAGGMGIGAADAGAARPPVPAGLVRYLVGDEADRDVRPDGPGLILMGGGRDVDAAFEWWRPRLAGGDVVVLRASGADGYNDYLLNDIGGCDSVETLLVTSRALADDAWVAWTVAHAEGIFVAGGDQSRYVEGWKGTALEDALHRAWARGAVIGGTSAGLAILGELVFSARAGGIDSDQALSDLDHPRMRLERDFLDLAPLRGLITDSHFGNRDRMGRLVAFLARSLCDSWADPVWGLGVDERTAVVVDGSGEGQVLGDGRAYLLRAAGRPATCLGPVELEADRWALSAGDRLQLGVAPAAAPLRLRASGGRLDPADPY